MRLTARTACLALISCSVAVVAASSLPHTSAAATLTNGDRVTRTVTVIVGASRKTHELKPGSLLKELCTKRCIVRIDNSDDKDFVLDGTERVTIEDGLLYYDGEVAPRAETEAKPQTGK